jgi:glycosyltransferase involved in cell wall biosynthesis
VILYKKEHINVKILCFDSATGYQLYKEGIYPSHPLYGGIELEKAGFHVVFLSKSKNSRLLFRLFANAWMILKEWPDAIFIPFITYDEWIICLLKMLRIIRIPIFGYAHKTIGARRRSRFWKMLYFKSYDKIFFLSPKTLEESVRSSIVNIKQAVLVPWGGDLLFYNNILLENRGICNKYISTGKEHRDFQQLINSFAETESNLEIFTAPHAGRYYDFLHSYVGRYSNIGIHLIENNATSFLRLAKQSASSFCFVIPLLDSEIHYCLGLSSLVEALALGKPIISTFNPYYPIDIEKEGIGINVTDLSSWINAISFLNENESLAQQMGEKARRLSEDIYNIENCGSVIIKSIENIVLGAE